MRFNKIITLVITAFLLSAFTNVNTPLLFKDMISVTLPQIFH